MNTTLPVTYDQLVPILTGGDPAELKRLLVRRPGSLADLAWFPTHPQKAPVGRRGVYRLLGNAVAAGAPAPAQTCFLERAGIRQLELVMDDDDRAAVTLYSLMFATGLPAECEAQVLRAGLAGRFFTASHLIADRCEEDPDLPSTPDFGGWLVTVTTFVYDRPAAPKTGEVRW